MKGPAALGELLIAEAFGFPSHVTGMAFVIDKTMFDDALSMTMSMESPNSTPRHVYGGLTQPKTKSTTKIVDNDIDNVDADTGTIDRI